MKWRFVLVLSSLLACGKGKAPSEATNSPASTETEASEPEAPMDPREAAEWQQAVQGEPEELMRLEDLVGCAGLRSRSARSDFRAVALRAMQYCPDFSELSFLANVAKVGKDDEARLALETIDELAARPRRPTDPEDGDEVHAGCGTLLALAKDASRARPLRLLAIRALRMLTDRGCVAPPDGPATDRDAQ